MNKPQNAIVTMVVLAGIANSYGAIRKGKDIVFPVVGGFVVLILLLVVAQANARIAEMFAGAYTITSLLTNGTDLVTGITGYVNPAAPRFDPGGQKVAASTSGVSFTGSTPGGTITPVTYQSAANTPTTPPPGATIIPAPTYSPHAPSATITPVTWPTVPSNSAYISYV